MKNRDMIVSAPKIGRKVIVRGFENVGPAKVIGHTEKPTTTYTHKDGSRSLWYGLLLQWNDEKPAYYSGADCYLYIDPEVEKKIIEELD